jgi:predicted RNA-binding Zn-ribbon protein involved in translation (DUF1610 family)
MKSLDKHLDSVAERMGGFLRGFDDPRVHLGSTARFNGEFRKVLALPAIHPSGEKKRISYSEAVGQFRVPALAGTASAPADPVTAMLRGLADAPVALDRARRELHPAALRNDLAALLRMPAMLFYVSISDQEAFFERLAQIAAREAFPLIMARDQGLKAQARCPSCGSALTPQRQGQVLQCGSCGMRLENVRSLPLVPGAAAAVSYELLRRMVALDLVVSYQEEGKIVPL